MKANELMIRDWVMVNDIEHTHPLQVAEIFKKSGAYYATLYWDGMPDNVNPETLTADVDKVLPIPLTPEILEKNGWRQDTYSNESWDNENIDALSLWGGEDEKEDWWWHVGFELVTPIKYVHEFQHALILCGIEKTIEL